MMGWRREGDGVVDVNEWVVGWDGGGGEDRRAQCVTTVPSLASLDTHIW